jgi:hypothetical protein
MDDVLGMLVDLRRRVEALEASAPVVIPQPPMGIPEEES